MALTMRDRAVAYTCKDEVDIYDHAKRIGGIGKIGTQCGAPEAVGTAISPSGLIGLPPCYRIRWDSLEIGEPAVG